jgi:O-antigen/teichoic acid export membrane protein
MVYLASGGFWLILEQIAGVFLSLGVAIAFGHFAGKDMYGNYKYVLSLATILGALSLSGLGDAVGQAAARGKDGALIQGFRTNLMWSGPFVLASLCVAAYYWLQGNPFVAGSMVVVAFCQPIAASSSYFASFLFGQRDFARGATYMIAESAITYGAVLAALLVGERAIMLVAAYFVSNAIASLYFTWKAQQHARNTEKDAGLFAFGAHLSVMNVIAVIADRFDSIIVFSLLGPAELATYTFALAAPEQLKGVIKNLYGLALPKFAERSLSDIQRTIWPKLGLLTLSVAGLMGLYILAAPLLFSYLFPIYLDAVPFTQWYALSVIVTGISSVLLSALTAHKKTRELYVVSNGAPLILIVSLTVLVPLFGIAGAVAAQMLFRVLYATIAAWQFMHAREDA